MTDSQKSTQAVSKEISTLVELAQAFSGQKDLFTLLGLIKDKATQLMDADRASIFLVDNETNELWTLMADGVDVIRFPYGKGIVGSVIVNNEILNIPDAENDPRFNKEVDKETGYHTRNILCVPMQNRSGQAVGAIEVLNKRDGAFTEYDESLLMILATQSAVAVENVEMLDDVKESLRQLDLLNRVQRRANYMVKLDDIFQMVLQELAEVFGGGTGIVMRIHPSHGTIGSFFLPGEQLQTFYAGDPKFLEWVCDHPELTDAFDSVPGRLEELKSKDMATFAGGAVAAMKDQDDLAGYLEIRGLPQDERLFNQRAMDFLKVVAGQLLSFVENNRLVEEKSQADKMAVVGNMVSTIVHDIKNPLSGISGYAQLIQRKSQDEKIKGFVDIMLDELGRLEDMNNELLTFVRGERIELDLIEMEVPTFVSEIVRIVTQDFQEHQIDLKASAEYEGSIMIDRNRMKRVFVNIANNARDAMPNGGNFVFRAEEAGTENVRFILQDTGIGMPPDARARIFEPFFTRGKKGGTGLGMAIAKNIVEKHNGIIEVASEQGKGTTFSIELPIKQ